MGYTRMPNNGAMQTGLEQRVLIAAPSGGDAEVLSQILQAAGISTRICDEPEELCQQINQAAAAAILAEEALDARTRKLLVETLSRQPEWSDFPLIVMTVPGESNQRGEYLLNDINDVAHPVLLQRPVRRFTLLSSVRAALQSRHRQYQVRDELEQRRHAEARLREADRRKDEFLATLAHELRNPLAPIRYAFDLLKLHTPASDDACTAEQMIDRQLQHMVRLIDDLLDVSRITRGKLHLRRERVELLAILNQALDACRAVVAAAEHRLDVSLPPRPIHLDADPVRLIQVFTNLLNNACKFTEPGGHITLNCEPDAGHALVRISDTGIGIPAEYLPRLFEMFSQVDGTPERPKVGLGIGLALARSLVEMHGGSIQAHSDGPDQGSEFVVRLPVQAAAIDPAANTPATPEDTGETTLRRILVVDDNPDITLSLGMILQLHGNQVETAHDGVEALATAARFHPQVILLDLGMPKLDGYATCRRLREQPEGNNVVIIALTGWGQDEDRRRTREAGFDAHLVKPVEVGTLLRLLAIPDQTTS